jgi:hypothetical protein
MNALALATVLFVVGAPPPGSPSAGPSSGPPPATSRPAPARQRVLVLDVTGELEQAARDTLTSLVGVRLARFSALDVVARSSISRLVALEGERQAVGCAGEDGACLAELADALDVDTLAVGTAGRLGGTTVFTLVLVERGGKTIARGSTQVSALDDLAARVVQVVDDVGQQATGQPPDADAVAPAVAAASSSPLALPAGSRPLLVYGGGAVAGTGILAFVAGVVPAVLYGGAAGDLRRLRVDYVERGGDGEVLDAATQKQREAFALQGAWNNAGRYAAWSGLALVAVGGGALAAGLLLQEAP